MWKDRFAVAITSNKYWSAPFNTTSYVQSIWNTFKSKACKINILTHESFVKHGRFSTIWLWYRKLWIYNSFSVIWIQKTCTMHLQEIYLLAKCSAISSVKWYIGKGSCSVLALQFQVIHLLASYVPYKIYMHP